MSADREAFYYSAMSAISKASNADSAKARLAEAERSHFWPEITDGQRETLKTAAKRTK